MEKSKPRSNMDDGSTRTTKTKKVTSAEASEERRSAILSSRPASKVETSQQEPEKMEVPLVKKKPQPSQGSAQKKPYRRVHPANQEVIEPNPQRQIMNPQVSFCEKIEELNESESHNTMQATQGNERDKPRFTFNIGQNLQE